MNHTRNEKIGQVIDTKIIAELNRMKVFKIWNILVILKNIGNVFIADASYQGNYSVKYM